MSQPGDEEASFRHPDTPKRSGGPEWWRRGAAGPGTSAGVSWAADGSHRLTPGPLTPRHSRQPTHNPFEGDDVTASLSLPTSSPSLFECVTSPNDKEETGWAIEQLAELHPAHIDVTPYHRQLLCQKYDAHTELQVQTAIDRFFNSEKIVPSPWGAPAVLRRTPQMGDCQQSPLVACPPPTARDASTQTLLTLPAELPAELERALAPYVCQSTEDRSQSRDDDDSMLSTSTLRRKLLFHGAASGEPASNDVSMADADGSVYHFPETPDQGHLLSRSPPSGSHRTSVPHRSDVDSPVVSPICKSMMASPSTNSIKSQGLAKIRYPSSDRSEPSDSESDSDNNDGGGGGAPAAAAAAAAPVAAAAAAAAAEVAAAAAAPGLAAELGSPGDQSAPHDTGYHSTLASLPSLSSRHLAAAESSQLARLLGSHSASMLASTRRESAEPSAPPPLEATLDTLHEAGRQPPVPIGSSTPSRAHVR